MVGRDLTSAKWLPTALLLAAGWAGMVSPIYAQDKPAAGDEKVDPISLGMAKDSPDLTKLTKDYDVWIDRKHKWVVVDGQVCLREGQLEMFACPKGTKDHESVVTVNCPSQFIHAGLLAIGATPGKTVKFDPMFTPASGPVVDIYVLWQDDAGKMQKVRAQEWVKNLKTEKQLDLDWVFGGSGFWRDEDTGKTHYYADSGEFICVSNFPSAMIDLPVASSQATADLLFVPMTDKIPPKGTKLRLVLAPRFEKKAAEPK